MQQFDADGSETISLAELEEADGGDRLTEGFASLDTDGDNMLSMSEIEAGIEAMRETGGAGGGMMQTTGADSPVAASMEAMFQSLMDSLSTEEEDSGTSSTDDLMAYAEQLYVETQEILNAF